MPKTIKNCTVCKKEFTTYKQKQQSCSQKCNGIRTKGENNPNFGNTWTREQKQKQSKLIKSKVDNDYREKAGSANRGKKFSSERIVKMHSSYLKHEYDCEKEESEKEEFGLAGRTCLAPRFANSLSGFARGWGRVNSPVRTRY